MLQMRPVRQGSRYHNWSHGYSYLPRGSVGSIHIASAGPTWAIFHQQTEHPSYKGVAGSADPSHPGWPRSPTKRLCGTQLPNRSSHSSRSSWSRGFDNSGSGKMAELSIPQVHTDTPRATSVYISSTCHGRPDLSTDPCGTGLEILLCHGSSVFSLYILYIHIPTMSIILLPYGFGGYITLSLGKVLSRAPTHRG